MKKLFILFFCIISVFVYLLSVNYTSNTNAEKISTKRFTLLKSKETGITFNNKIKDTKDQNILLYANFYGGAGVGIGDFNNDGLQDIYFAGNLVDDKMYLNQGNLKFKDVTKKSGIINDGGWSTGVTIADVNNDGYVDIMLVENSMTIIPNGELTYYILTILTALSLSLQKNMASMIHKEQDILHF